MKSVVFKYGGSKADLRYIHANEMNKIRRFGCCSRRLKSTTTPPESLGELIEKKVHEWMSEVHTSRGDAVLDD